LRIDDIHRDAIGALNDPFSSRPAMAADDVVSVNPKVAGAYFLSTIHGSETKLRAAAGLGFARLTDSSWPSPTTLAAARTQPELRGRHRSGLSGRLIEATWFRNNFDDLIVAVGKFVDSSRYRTDNISNARAQGSSSPPRFAHACPASICRAVSATPSRQRDSRARWRAVAPAPFTVGQLLNRPRQ
jgi:hypothetical protein